MKDSMLGKTAIVIGAGIGGLTAARALSDYFNEVIILERDKLPAQPECRAGTPQDRHPHGLLGGGLRALEKLFPGFEKELVEAGVVPFRLGYDVLLELPGFRPCFPRHDLGLTGYYMSRPLLEFLIRQRVTQIGNITIRQNCRVRELLIEQENVAVKGVRFIAEDGQTETLAAELVVDGSGRGALTMSLLEQLGLPHPKETTIGLDVNYATAIFRIPPKAGLEWVAARTAPQPPSIRRGIFLQPVEGDRWMVTLAGRGLKLPADREGYMEFAQKCRTTTVYDVISDAEWLEEVARYSFPQSVRRNFDLSNGFPARLLPIGDVICQFNPVWGQGMAVAIMESDLLRELLAEWQKDAKPLDALPERFLAMVQDIIDVPWRTSAYPDLADPDAIGERPEDLQQELRFRDAVRRLSAKDPEVYKLNAQVIGLLAPPSILEEPSLLERIEATIAETN